MSITELVITMMIYTTIIQIIIINIIGNSFVSLAVLSVFKTIKKNPIIISTTPIFSMLEMGIYRRKTPIVINSIAMILC